MIFGPGLQGYSAGRGAGRKLARRGRQCAVCLQPQGNANDHGRRRHAGGGAAQGRVLIVDDVMSAGTAARESIAIIQAAVPRPQRLGDG